MSTPWIGLCAALAESVAEVARVSNAATPATREACLKQLTAREFAWVREGISPVTLLALREATQHWLAKGVFGARTAVEIESLIAVAVARSIDHHGRLNAGATTFKSLRSKLTDYETEVIDYLRLHEANWLGARAALHEEAEAKEAKSGRVSLTFAERQASFLQDLKEAQDMKLVVDEAYVSKLAAGHQVPVPRVQVRK